MMVKIGSAVLQICEMSMSSLLFLFIFFAHLILAGSSQKFHQMMYRIQAIEQHVYDSNCNLLAYLVWSLFLNWWLNFVEGGVLANIFQRFQLVAKKKEVLQHRFMTNISSRPALQPSGFVNMRSCCSEVSSHALHTGWDLHSNHSCESLKPQIHLLLLETCWSPAAQNHLTPLRTSCRCMAHAWAWRREHIGRTRLIQGDMNDEATLERDSLFFHSNECCAQTDVHQWGLLWGQSNEAGRTKV